MRKILQPHPQPEAPSLPAVAQPAPNQPEKCRSATAAAAAAATTATTQMQSQTQQQSAAEREAKLKAEARAYALSGTTREGKQHRSSSSSLSNNGSSGSKRKARTAPLSLPSRSKVLVRPHPGAKAAKSAKSSSSSAAAKAKAKATTKAAAAKTTTKAANKAPNKAAHKAAHKAPNKAATATTITTTQGPSRVLLSTSAGPSSKRARTMTATANATATATSIKASAAPTTATAIPRTQPMHVAATNPAAAAVALFAVPHPGFRPMVVPAPAAMQHHQHHHHQHHQHLQLQLQLQLQHRQQHLQHNPKYPQQLQQQPLQQQQQQQQLQLQHRPLSSQRSGTTTVPATRAPTTVSKATKATPTAAAAAVAAAVPALNQTKYDPEYLKMIQSLGELDDFSIWDNLSDVEDVDFRLSDLEDDDDDDDDDDEEDDDCNEDDADDDEDGGVVTGLHLLKDSKNATPGAVTTLAAAAGEGPVSVTAPSSPSAAAANPSASHASANTQQLSFTKPTHTVVTATVAGTTRTPGSGCASPPLAPLSPLENDLSDDLLYRNLEEELGSLLEEDLEAAVQSLYNTTSAGGGSDDAKPKKKGKTSKANSLSAGSSSQQKKTVPQQHPPTAFCSVANVGANTPVTAAVLAAEAKRKAEAEAASKRGNTKQQQQQQQLQQKQQQQRQQHPDTPLRETAKHSGAAVTYQQSQQLRKLLRKHYQLLTQQAILSVRAAQQLKTGSSTTASNSAIGGGTGSTTPTTPGKSLACDFLSGENETDLTEILDLAVGMLQDLDQNRKDSIRTSIQLALGNGGHNATTTKTAGGSSSFVSSANANAIRGGTTTRREGDDSSTNAASASTGARRSLLSQFDEGHNHNHHHHHHHKSRKAAANPLETESTPRSNQGGRLTRAAFRRLQAQPIAGSKRTAFDIPGLLKLNETFATIDDSVNVNHNTGAEENAAKHEGTHQPKKKKVNILEAETHAQACRDVLKDAGANVEEQLLPGVLDLSENFSQLQEHLGDDFQPPCSVEQEQFLRKNRNLFTSGEDNLVLRGVNLYGEKQWILIGDRYLPDRSINIISQRYSKLCVMLYKAHGIWVDAQGNLAEPPKLESVDDIDEARVEAVGLKLVDPPAILNVHRWSMEEDLTILKAVPIMGHMWAELGARLIPHRDRGHLRKRYQVLERRVKATITRGFKAAAKARSASASKTSGRSSYRMGATKAKGKTPAKASTKTVTKPTVGLAAATKARVASNANPPPSSAKARPSPGRTGKKAPSPARSPSKSKTARAASTKPSPSKRKTTTTIKEKTTPVMSLESAAASLACMQGKNLGAPVAAKPPSGKTAPKRATLQQVAPPLAPSTTPTNKPISHPHPKGHTPQSGLDPGVANYGATPLPAAAITAAGAQPLPPGSKNAPPHHPLYPFHYYPGYYHPHYAYPSHSPHPPGENNGDPPPPSSSTKTTNTPPPQLLAGPKGGSYFPKPSFSAEGKQYNNHLASPTPGVSGSRSPAELSTPNAKSFLANIPRLLGEGFSVDADASRLEYEKLIEGMGGGNEDTQMSKLKKMMQNEDESAAANAIVSHLAKSPGRGTKPPAEGSGLSIMARVLKGASSSTSSFATAAESAPPKPPLAPEPAAVASPTKKRSGSLPRHGSMSSSAAPATPQKTSSANDSSFYSTGGTSLGLSPGLRSLGASVLLKNDVGSTSLSAPFSPAPNGGSLLRSDGLGTNLSVPYSPAPSMLLRAFDEKTGDENRFALPMDVHDNITSGGRICEDSNQVLGDLAVGADLSENGVAANMSVHANSVGGKAGNSLIIAPDEFDAISGLGALSNSPFKAVRESSDDPKPTKPARSFFARVVGESKETSPQKKLF